MERDQLVKNLALHKKEIENFGVKSLAIFGSVARDEAGPGSDIDILMEFRGKTTFRQYMNLKFYYQDMLGYTIDLVTPKALKPQLRPLIEKEAIYVT